MCRSFAPDEVTVLLASAGRFVAMWVVHCATVKLDAVLSWMLTPRWRWTSIPLAIVKVMIDVPIKMFRSVEPRSRANKYTA